LAPMLRRDVRVEPLAHGFEVRLREIALEQAPVARLKPAIPGLVVALPEAREHAEDARAALSGEHPIGALQLGTVASGGDIAVDHRAFDFGRDIAPGVFQYGGEIVGAVTRHRVAAIEQTKMPDALALA